MAITQTSPSGFASKNSKVFIRNLLILIFLTLVAAPSIARPVHVKAYTRKDGTSVRSHNRNDPRTQGLRPNITQRGSINSGQDYTNSLNSGITEERLVQSQIKQTKSDCELKILQINQIQQGKVVRVLGDDCSMVFNAVR
jgi:hypothetical protein